MMRVGMAAALAFFALAAATPADAALNLCNRTSYVIYAATASLSGTNVATKGWTRLAPGACKNALTEDLAAPAYYVYARTSLAHAGPSRAWGGTASFCVRDGDFAISAASAAACDDESFPLSFAQIDTHHMRSWTMTFTESAQLASLQDAELAGLKRLLRDNGLKVGAIDGRPDKDAAASLATFRARMRMPPKASAADLFDALETDAMKTTAPAGYAICNDSKAPLLAALGQQNAGKWASHGWWKVAPGSCAKAITTPLAADKIYLYAQHPDGRPIVRGPAAFCISNVAFDIPDRTRCKERGLQDAGFAETATKGLSGYAVHIGDEGLLAPYAFHPATSK